MPTGREILPVEGGYTTEIISKVINGAIEGFIDEVSATLTDEEPVSTTVTVPLMRICTRD